MWQTVLISVACNLFSVTCAIMGGCIAISEKDGWGWFLFVGALFACCSFANKEEGSSEKDVNNVSKGECSGCNPCD